MRRAPFPHEIRAAVDFAALDTAYETTATRVADLWEREWLPDMVDELRAAIVTTKGGEQRKRVTRSAMAGIRVNARGGDALAELLLDVARTAALGATDEMLTQGLSVLAPTDAQLRGLVADHAGAVTQQLADGLSLAGSRRAVQAAQGRTPVEVADDVTAYLNGLTHSWERDQLSGAVQQATNAGRFLVFQRVPTQAPVAYHSSELLDAATCDQCAREDGREYPSLAEAMRAYPTGGFIDCRGGPRCRGTVVAALPEDEPSPDEILRRPDLWGG